MGDLLRRSTSAARLARGRRLALTVLALLVGLALLARVALRGGSGGGDDVTWDFPAGSEAGVAAMAARLTASSPALAAAVASAVHALPSSGRRPRRLIIDVGANSGNSYEDLKNNWVGRTIIGNMSDYEVFLMEPNPVFRPYIERLIAAEHAAAGKKFITYMPVAAGVEDGFVAFHIDPSMPRAGKFTEEDGYGSGGSSLLGGMPAVDPSNPANPNLRSGAAVAGAPQNTVSVPSIDLARWLEHETSPMDEIHLKVDVEGFEYSLMQRLLPRGLLCVEHLYMELHSGMLDQSTDASLHGMGDHERTIFWLLHGCPKPVNFHPWA